MPSNMGTWREQGTHRRAAASDTLLTRGAGQGSARSGRGRRPARRGQFLLASASVPRRLTHRISTRCSGVIGGLNGPCHVAHCQSRWRLPSGGIRHRRRRRPGGGPVMLRQVLPTGARSPPCDVIGSGSFLVRSRQGAVLECTEVAFRIQTMSYNMLFDARNPNLTFLEFRNTSVMLHVNWKACSKLFYSDVFTGGDIVTCFPLGRRRRPHERNAPWSIRCVFCT